MFLTFQTYPREREKSAVKHLESHSLHRLKPVQHTQGTRQIVEILSKTLSSRFLSFLEKTFSPPHNVVASEEFPQLIMN